MKKAAILGYIICLHLVLGFAVLRPDIVADQHWRIGVKPPEPAPYAEQLHRMFRVMDRDRAVGRATLIGDSHFQLMDASLLNFPALNFGIGDDTARNITARLKDYDNLEAGGGLFIWAGQNDLRRRDSNAAITDIRKLIQEAGNGPVAILTVPFVSERVQDHENLNTEIQELNTAIKQSCRRPCRLIDANNALSKNGQSLSPQYDSGDGVHLNAAGYAEIARLLNEAAAAK